MNERNSDKLSYANRMFQVLSEFANEQSNGNSCELIKVAGPVDRIRLKNAVKLVIAKHDNLRAVILSRKGEQFRTVKSNVPEVELEYQELDLEGESQIRTYLADNVWRTAPLGLTKPPIIKVYVSKIGGFHYIQFVTSHVWSDAKSGFQLVADILSFYDKPEQNEANVEREPCAREFDEDVLKIARKEGVAIGWWPAFIQMVRDLFYRGGGISVAQGAPQKTQFYIHHFAQEKMLEQVKQEAKRRDITVHSLLIPVLVDCCHDHDLNRGVNNIHYTLHDLYSLRGCGENEYRDTYDNFVFPFEYTVKWDHDLQKMIESVTDEVNRIKNGDIYKEYNKERLMLDLLRFLPRKAAFRFLFKYCIKGNIICTNPGIIPYDFPMLGDSEIVDFYNFPQLFPPGEAMFVFSTFRGVMRILVVYNQSAIDDVAMHSLVSSFETKLGEIIGGKETKASAM